MRFSAGVSQARLSFTLLLAALLGVAAGVLMGTGLTELTHLPAGATRTAALAFGGLVGLGVALLAMRSIRDVVVDGRFVILTTWLGSRQSFDLDTHDVQPFLTYHKGSVSGRGLMFTPSGPGDPTKLVLPITAVEFDELTRLLVGDRPPVPPEAEEGAVAPHTFAISRPVVRLFVGGLLIFGGLMVAVLIALALRSEHATLLVGLLAVVGVSVVTIGLTGSVRSPRWIRSITVAKDHVAFDRWTVPFASLRTIELQTPTTLANLSATLIWRDGRRETVPLTLGRTASVFPDYPRFLALVHSAATAAGVEVRYSYSG